MFVGSHVLLLAYLTMCAPSAYHHAEYLYLYCTFLFLFQQQPKGGHTDILSNLQTQDRGEGTSYLEPSTFKSQSSRNPVALAKSYSASHTVPGRVVLLCAMSEGTHGCCGRCWEKFKNSSLAALPVMTSSIYSARQSA